MSLPEKPVHKPPNYLGVFIALALLTVAEIGVTYLPVNKILFLIPLALIKAALVVLYFMHLKSDARVFGLVFLMGVLMAFSFIIAMAFLFAPLIGFNTP